MSEQKDLTDSLARGNDGTDLTPLIRALATLGKELDLAFLDSPERVLPEDERARYTYALRELAKFLTACGSRHDRQFWRLAIALNDLNYGRQDPLLKPTPTGGVNPGDTTPLWCARANVALGIYALVQAKLRRKRAASKAAKDFPQLCKLAGSEREKPSPVETKILGWYDEFLKERNKSRMQNDIARTLFDSARSLIDVAAQDSTETLFRFADHFFVAALR
jgi:hypothetical protein